MTGFSILAAQMFEYFNVGNTNPIDYRYSVEVRGTKILVTDNETGKYWIASQEDMQNTLNYFDKNRSISNENSVQVFSDPLPFCDTPTELPYDPWNDLDNPFFHGENNGGGGPPPPPDSVPCPNDQNVKVTTKHIETLFPSINRGVTEKICTYINLYKDQFGISGRKELAYLLSQVIVESESFTILSEKWKYTTVRRIREMFREVPEWQAPSLFNCECLFNKVYANENENGDSASGDGFRYRGRGLMQLTYKESYRKFGKYLRDHNIDPNANFVNNPDLIASDLKYAVLSALWEFGIDKRVSKNRNGRTRIDDAMANDDIDRVSALVNGKKPANKQEERRAALLFFKTKFCL